MDEEETRLKRIEKKLDKLIKTDEKIHRKYNKQRTRPKYKYANVIYG